MSQVSTRPGSPNSNDRQEFEKWMTKYNKHYDTDDEKERRFKVFQQTLREIEAHNALQTTWTKGLNPFSDMTPEESNEQYLGVIHTEYPPDISEQNLMEQYKGVMFMGEAISGPAYTRILRKNTDAYVIPYDCKFCTRRSSMADQRASSSTGRGKHLLGVEPNPPPPPPRRRIRYSTEEVQPVDGEEPVNLDTRCHLDKWIVNPSDEHKLDYPDHLHRKNIQLVKPSGFAMRPVSPNSNDRQWTSYEDWLAVYNKHYEVSPNANDRQQFEEWMTKYNKHYDTEDEKEMRFKVFQQTLRRIEDFDVIPNTRSTQGLNIFSDMTREEFRKTYINGSSSDDVLPKAEKSCCCACDDVLPKAEKRCCSACKVMKNIPRSLRRT